jgi:hypothetical protein
LGIKNAGRAAGLVYISDVPLRRRPRGPVGEERMYTSGWPWPGGIWDWLYRLPGMMPLPWLIDLVEVSGVPARLAFLDTPGKIGVVTPG